jgi:hypothetical protein
MFHQLMCRLGYHSGKWSELKTAYFQKTSVIELPSGDYELGPRRIYEEHYQMSYCPHCGRYERKVISQYLLDTIPRPMGGYKD